jgi:hypothetical protein
MICTIIRKSTILLLFAVILFSCKKDIKPTDDINLEGSVSMKGLIPYSFDWKTVNFMPTPPGQAPIPVPWVGPGSLASLYGLDVINDNRHEDGWVLLYSTFDANASGPVPNPYFILYNKYRGLMRIFLYLTGSFAIPSSHLTNGVQMLYANSGISSQMLAYIGNTFVDLTKTHDYFIQIEKAPSDGSMPMAPNKWYMMQYELAYDPNISSIPFNDIQMSWFMNFNTITQISLGGNIEGTIKGTISSGGTSASNAINSSLLNLGKAGGTVGLAALGSQFFNNASGTYPGSNFTYDNQGNITGTVDHHANNNLGLPDALFTSMKNGMAAGLSAATGNIPGAVAGVFSALFGGSSQPNQQTVSLNLDARITLNGTGTTSGSFPASPSSVYVPGTLGLTASNINNIQYYLPLYERPLGVFSISNAPIATATKYIDQIDTRKFEIGNSVRINTNSYTIRFNPDVVNNTAEGATISNLTQQLVVDANGDSHDATKEQVGDIAYWTGPASGPVDVFITSSTDKPNPKIRAAYLRVTFDITPNSNPAAKAKIIKTFICRVQ